MAAPPLDLLVHERDVISAVVDNVVMVSVFRSTSVARLHQVGLAAGRRFARHPTGIGSLVVADRGTHLYNAPQSDAERKEFSEGLSRVASYIRATAVVVEHTGFVAVSIRMFVSGVALVARLPYPLKAFDALDDGVQWLVPRVTPADKVAAEVQAVTATVAQVRALLDGRPAG